MKEIKIRRFYTQQQVCGIVFFIIMRLGWEANIRCAIFLTLSLSLTLAPCSHLFHDFGLIALTKRNRKKYNISVDNK